MHDIYDVTIIGGGPAGLYTAFYSGMRALKTKLIEAKPEWGGLVTHFYPEKTIYDVGGVPRIKGEDLVADLQKQAKTFAPTMIENQVIEQMSVCADGVFRLASTDGDLHFTRKIILAVGSGHFTPNKLELKEAADFENNSLFYAVRHMRQFAGKQVVISGGGDGALEWAAELAPICRQVTLVYRGDTFARALEHNVARAEKQTVAIRRGCDITALSGEHGRLSGVTIHCRAMDQTEIIPADALIVNHGFQFSVGGLGRWGMARDENGGFRVDQRMETSVKGIFAVGNAAAYPQKLYLIAAGFVEGPTAVNSIKHDLDPEAPAQAMVSTHHHFFTQEL